VARRTPATVPYEEGEVSAVGDEPGQQLQPGDQARHSDGPGHDAVRFDTIAEFEALDEAKKVERMAELQIVERLRAVGFDEASPEWRTFGAALAEYGYAVLVAWGVTGALFVHGAKHGGLSSVRVQKAGRLSEDEARALAVEVLFRALDKFRSRSLETWSPSGGASLKTYFVGRCLMELAGAYAKWYRKEKRAYLVETIVDDGSHTPRPDDVAVCGALTDELLADDPDLREAFKLQAEGYRLDEIAAVLGMSVAALRSRMNRFRKRKRRDLGTDHPDA
jgi:DNA-directed RNA polymerase specialized sigma24 family protein